ncbi:LMBR1 domain-containing protein 2 [Mortierella polycephala]|uniref:LMBR1 domain-containing protein 2 n=1 Tax=Mortierella polycephala TaxID=41804 RepID=A0A9P6QHF7_9FUNG|nr:LMBR1 domain-containing protein 2 [Mortierella polycephala]
MSYGAIEAISFFTMLYMCTCAYTALMKMKLLNNYVLVPNHHTDEPTLLFIGSYLCRLTLPLVYNYLTISSLGKEDSTVFAGYMGRIDMVPFLGEFNYYMPYVILFPTVITLFNVFAKMFALCSISDNFFDNDDDDGGIGGDLEEGLHVLKDARRDEERRLIPERAGLNRDFTARRGAAFESYNNKKNRRRGEASTQSMFGEGSSTREWRDVRPQPSGTNPRSFQEPYFDNSSDDDDADNDFDGFGRRSAIEPFGSLNAGARAGANVGGSVGIGGRNSLDSSSRLGPSSNRSSFRNLVKPDTQSSQGPLKALWQKLVRPKQAISLDRSFSPDLMDSDDARSSLDSTGHDQRQPPGRTTFRPDRNSSSTRTGPALMFASVQQHPSNFSRSLQEEDDNRQRLLSVGDARVPGSGASFPRPQSPQGYSGQSEGLGHGQGPRSNRSSRPSNRVFGTSVQAGRSGNPSRTSGSQRSSPLIKISDDDDD